MTPPPATISGLRGGADDLGGPAITERSGQRPGDVPGAFGEQRFRPVVRLGLHVLRRWRLVAAPVSTGSVRTRIAPSSGGGQLLGPPHPVEEAGQRLERVVDGDVAGVTAARVPAVPGS